jgi:hypothetical protein
MRIFHWLTQRLFTGEILQDFGDVSDDWYGVAHSRTSIQLCRRRGRLELVFCNVSTALLAASVRYWTIEVTPQSLERLTEVVSSARRQFEDDCRNERPAPKKN